MPRTVTELSCLADCVLGCCLCCCVRCTALREPELCCAVAATAFSSRAPNQHGSRNSRRKLTSSSSSSSWYWDADMAQAAAAAQLDPDELHNLVFGRSSNDGSSKGSSRRQQRKAARRRAKSLRKQAASMGWAYDGFGFAWAAAGSANEGRWGGSAYASSADSDTDSYSDTEDDDDEYLGGAYSYASPGRFTRQGRMNTQQRQWQEWYYQAQPDWQWWTEEQERWVALVLLAFHK